MESIQFIILASALLISRAWGEEDLSYTAYDCSNGEMRDVGTTSERARSHPTEAKDLAIEGIHWSLGEDGYFNGNVSLIMGTRVFLRTCKEISVKTMRSPLCYHRGTLPGKTASGELVFVDDRYIVIENPAIIPCARDQLERADEDLKRKLSMEHRLAEISEAEKGNTLKNFNFLFNNTEAINDLAFTLETCLCSLKDSKVWQSLNLFYRKYIAKFLMAYTGVYTIYTGFLVIAATYLNLGLVEKLRLAVPAIRRTNDLLNYYKQRKEYEETKARRTLRSQRGLPDEMPFQLYANKHLCKMYTTLQEMNKRLDRAGIPVFHSEETLDEDENSRSQTDDASRLETDDSSPSASLAESRDSNPPSVRLERRDAFRGRARYASMRF